MVSISNSNVPFERLVIWSYVHQEAQNNNSEELTDPAKLVSLPAIRIEKNIREKAVLEKLLLTLLN